MDGQKKENDEDHDRMFRLLERNRDEYDQIFEDLDEHEKKITKHETRIKKVESMTHS